MNPPSLTDWRCRWFEFDPQKAEEVIASSGVGTFLQWERKPDWDLDAISAFRRFYGKTQEEVMAWLKEGIMLIEDLNSMTDPCFLYYVSAYFDYLLTAESIGDTVAATSLLRWTQERCELLMPRYRDRIVEVLRFLQNNQDWLDADPKYYPRIEKRVATCLAALIADQDPKPQPSGTTNPTTTPQGLRRPQETPPTRRPGLPGF
jgi:hypothetical protein